MERSEEYKASRRALWRTLVVVFAIGVGAALWPTAKQLLTRHQPLEQRVEGQIIDHGSGRALSGVQVLVDGGGSSQAVTTFSDSTGHFSAQLRLAGRDSSYSVAVRAPGYDTLQFGRPKAADSQFKSAGLREDSLGLLRLLQRSDDEQAHPDKQQEFTSAPVLSGRGADFGPTYTLCSDPPEKVSHGYTIKSAQFFLNGDRQCNAWATCTETVHNSSQVCWAFRMQGHSECLSPFHTCPDARPSIGVLHVTYGYLQASPLSGHPQVAYVQFADQAQRGGAQELCNDLERRGYFCPAPVEVRGTFSPGIRIFDLRDESSGREAADIVSRHLHAVEATPTIETEVTPSSTAGRLEIWLNGSHESK